jgi:hypothetical protein
MSGLKARYEVGVVVKDKPFRIPKEYTEQLKGVLSAKKISSLRREAVQCPVLGIEVPFLVCFQCPSFIRRVKGVVYCAGNEPPNWPPKKTSRRRS